MFCQLIGLARYLAATKIFGRTHYRHVEVRADTGCDHIAVYLFAKANTRIEPVRDEVHEAIIVDYLHRQIRVVGQQLRQSWRKDRHGRMFDR